MPYCTVAALLGCTFCMLFQFQIKELTSFVVVLAMFICVFGIGTHAIFCPNDQVDSEILTRLFTRQWMLLFGFSSVEDFAGIIYCNYRRSPVGSLYVVTIWNVVFANKSRKLGWIWMKLGRWGSGLKRLSLARFQRNRAMGFRESAKNGSQRRCLRRNGSATFLGSITAKLSTNTCPVASRDTWFHIPEKFPLRDRICRRTLFLGYPICNQPTGHGKRSATPTLFPSPGGHPTDMPYLGDFC